jgi:hypothetical protein
MTITKEHQKAEVEILIWYIEQRRWNMLSCCGIF